MTRWGQLWAGPMDGERVFLGDGEPPLRVGMHRTAGGGLVAIRSRALLLDMPLVADQVAVYERATAQLLGVLLAWRGHTEAQLPTDADPDTSLYVFRDVVTRWLAASS